MAKRTKEEQDQLNAEYQQELRKLKRRVRDITKRGYSIPFTIIPPKPKTINPESIQNLRKRTPDYIYARSVYVSPEGTKIKGTKRRAQEKSEAAKKAAETRKQNFYARNKDLTPSPTPTKQLEITFQQLYQDLAAWTPESWWTDDFSQYKTRDRNRTWAILEGAINEKGAKKIAEIVEQNSSAINELVQKILYESGNKYRVDSREGEINSAINQFKALITGESLTVSESLELTAQAEQQGYYDE